VDRSLWLMAFDVAYVIAKIDGLSLVYWDSCFLFLLFSVLLRDSPRHTYPFILVTLVILRWLLRDSLRALSVISLSNNNLDTAWLNCRENVGSILVSPSVTKALDRTQSYRQGELFTKKYPSWYIVLTSNSTLSI